MKLTLSSSLLLSFGLAANSGITMCTAQQSKLFAGTLINTSIPPNSYVGAAQVDNYCTATLIYDDIMLTAASCSLVFGDGVRLNSDSKRSGGQVRQVVSYLPHSDFDGGLSNNIMMLKLDQPTGNTFLNPAQDPSHPVTNANLTAYGFLDRFRNADSELLVQRQGVIVGGDIGCNVNAITTPGFTIASQFCAQDTSGSICGNDLGGPLVDVANNELVGITAKDHGCSTRLFVQPYTRVSFYDTWIRTGLCRLAKNPPNYCPTTVLSGRTIPITVEWRNDNNPNHNQWRIYTDDGFGRQVARQGHLGAANGVETEVKGLAVGNYIFEVTDLSGDGTANSKGSGYYALSMKSNDEKIVLSNVTGVFTYVLTFKFTVPKEHTHSCSTTCKKMLGTHGYSMHHKGLLRMIPCREECVTHAQVPGHLDMGWHCGGC